MNQITEKLTLELWERVLEKLEDPLDRLKALEVFDLPELDERKAGWLFAVTLPVILKQLDCHVDYYYLYYAKNSVDPLQKAFFSCRLVSHDCFNAVEKFVDEHWEDCDYNYSPHKRIHSLFMPKLIIGQLILEGPWLSQLYNKIKHHSLHTCPIMTKHVSIYYSGGPIEDNRFNNANAKAILGLLERIGHLLLSVKFVISDFNQANTGEFITRALLLLPNVRNLTLEFNMFALGDLEDEDEMDGNWQRDDINQPVILPNLPNLKTLSINPLEQITVGGRISIPFQFYFTQVTILQLNFNLWTAQFNQAGLFSNLQKMFLGFVDMDQEGEVENLTELLRNLEAPQLMYFQANSSYSWDLEFEDAIANVKDVEEKCISILSEKYPQRKWESTSGFWKKEYTCKIYDSAVINVPSRRQWKENVLLEGLIGISLCIILFLLV